MCKRGNRNRGEWSVQATDSREEVAHSWETQQKAVSIHCVSAGFPTRGPSAWKGECISFSWHGCLFILWPTALPAQKDSPYRFDVYDTHTHFLGGDRWKGKTLAHGKTSVSCVNRHVRPHSDSVCDSIMVACLDLAFSVKWATILYWRISEFCWK